MSWNTENPPKDGTTIVAIGKVMWSDEFSTCADPFTAEIHWCKDQSGYEGWHFSDGMTVASGLDDKVIVHFWILPPAESKQRPVQEAA